MSGSPGPRLGSSALVGCLIAVGCLTDPASYAPSTSSTGGGAVGGQGPGGGGASSAGGSGGAGGGVDPGVVAWLVPIAGPGEQHVNALASTVQGAVYAGGDWEGAPDVPVLGPPCSGTKHAFVHQIAADGRRGWLRCFGTDASVSALDVNGDGDVAVVGTFSGTLDPDGLGAQASSGGTDVFVIVLDASGTIVWGRTFGAGGDDRGDGVGVSTGEVIYVSGSFRGTLQLDALSASAGSQADLFVAKLTPTQAIWLEQLENGSPEPTLFVSVKANANGPIVGAGSFQGTLDPDGPGPLAAVTADGTDAFTVGFETDGTRTFFHPIGGADEQRATGVQTSTGAFVVGGVFSGTVDFDGAGPLPSTTAAGADAFLLAQQFNGDLLGLASVSGGGTQRGRGAGLATVGGSSYALVGQHFGATKLRGETVSPPSGAPDGFIATFADASLSPGFARAIGPSGGAQALTAVTGVGGAFVVGGEFDTTLDLDGTTTSLGGTDAFVAKLVP